MELPRFLNDTNSISNNIANYCKHFKNHYNLNLSRDPSKQDMIMMASIKA